MKIHIAVDGVAGNFKLGFTKRLDLSKAAAKDKIARRSLMPIKAVDAKPIGGKQTVAICRIYNSQGKVPLDAVEHFVATFVVSINNFLLD